ncbi:nucleotidyltransferase domain-containing protein [Candidatus Woesearchaeota archaeon]|nr:nucleotidyltransferase domain-containing protein [Candidatus Woesearchaeota archaeon]
MVKAEAERRRLIEQIKEFKKANRVERMIIFGSLATGSFTKDSDIDIIVVDRKFSGQDRLERGKGFWVSWHKKHKIPRPVDFLFYSPEEFRRQSGKVSIVSEAIREGIEV